MWFFLELEDEVFIGDIASWESVDLPTTRVIEFEKNIIWLSKHKNIANLKVILTYFAEQGKTTTINIQTNPYNIREALFTMSTKNFDVWTDNLVIEITH